jgi:teichuronic acid biosynthesis glycosyltransferase TuaC
MKVLFVTNYREGWSENPSAGIFVERQAASLRAAGVDVDFFDLGRSHSPFRLLRKWRGLRAEIRRSRPDLVHAQYGTIVSIVTAMTFHPMIVTYGGSDLIRGASVALWRIYLGIFLSNVASLFAKHVICVSEELRRSLWWRRRGVAVIPRGVNLAAFTPGSRDEARAELGWDAHRRIVLIDGGRDPHNKGLDIAQRAIDIVRGELPDTELFVIHGVTPDRIPVLLRAGDALICASRQEGSPNIVKESLACALPVVGVRVGDVPERLAGVTPGAVVDRTPEAIANALLPILRAPRRSNGPEIIRQLSLEAVAARIIQVYEEAAR